MIDNMQKVLLSSEFGDLVRAARRYVSAQLLSEPPAPREEDLVERAFELVRVNGNYGRMWTELRKALDVCGGSTDNEHARMKEEIERLKYDESVRKAIDEELALVRRTLESVQHDANVLLEQRRKAEQASREAHDVITMQGEAVQEFKDRALAAELEAKTLEQQVCNVLERERGQQYIMSMLRGVLGCGPNEAVLDAATRVMNGTTSEQSERAIKFQHDRIKELERERELREHDVGQKSNDAYAANLHAHIKQLEDENARLKNRIESAEINLGYAREAIGSVENELGYVSGKLRGDHDK